MCGTYPRTKQLLLHAAICYFGTPSDIASKSQIPEWRSPKDFKHKADNLVVVRHFTFHVTRAIHFLHILTITFQAITFDFNAVDRTKN